MGEDNILIRIMIALFILKPKRIADFIFMFSSAKSNSQRKKIVDFGIFPTMKFSNSFIPFQLPTVGIQWKSASSIDMTNETDWSQKQQGGGNGDR